MENNSLTGVVLLEHAVRAADDDVLRAPGELLDVGAVVCERHRPAEVAHVARRHVRDPLKVLQKNVKFANMLFTITELRRRELSLTCRVVEEMLTFLRPGRYSDNCNQSATNQAEPLVEWMEVVKF